MLKFLLRLSLFVSFLTFKSHRLIYEWIKKCLNDTPYFIVVSIWNYNSILSLSPPPLSPFPLTPQCNMNSNKCLNYIRDCHLTCLCVSHVLFVLKYLIDMPTSLFLFGVEEYEFFACVLISLSLASLVIHPYFTFTFDGFAGALRKKIQCC